MLISPEYRLLNAELHQVDATWGHTPDHLIYLIRDLAGKLGLASILDYGAGKQRLKHALPMQDIRSYDPAIPGIDMRPEPADLLVCCGTCEHFEPDCLDAILDDMASLAIHAAMLVVSTIPSSKVLADGSNAHRIIEPMDWWLPHLMKRWEVNTAKVGLGHFLFIGRPKGWRNTGKV